MSDQTPGKKPELHPKINQYLQSAVYITVLITFLSPWLTTYIIPNWALFVVLPSFLGLAFNFYRWYRNRRFILAALTQQTCALTIAICVWNAYVFFGKGDLYNYVIGYEWVVTGLGWLIYSYIASIAMSNQLSKLDRAYAPQTAHILAGCLISSRGEPYDSPGTPLFMEENHGPVCAKPAA